jgi:hypothetical protein
MLAHFPGAFLLDSNIDLSLFNQNNLLYTQEALWGTSQGVTIPLTSVIHQKWALQRPSQTRMGWVFDGMACKR